MHITLQYLVQKSNKNTKVTWESYFASETTKAEFDEFIEFLSNFYAQSLKNLKESYLRISEQDLFFVENAMTAIMK